MSITPIRPTLHEADGLRLAYCRCDAGPHVRPFEEQHTWYSVSLVTRGIFSYRSRSGAATLSPGWLMLGNAGDPYLCSHEHNDGRGDDCIILTLSETALDRAQLARFGRAALPPQPRVAALLGGLAALPTAEISIEEACVAVAAEIRRALVGEAPNDGANKSARDYAAAAARYIEQHAAEAPSLATIARAVGLSPYHFLRIFRRTVGITPHQYLVRARLLRAVALLRDTSLAVTTIAHEVGWADLSSFLRLFRREIGCSPRELRRDGSVEKLVRPTAASR